MLHHCGIWGSHLEAASDLLYDATNTKNNINQRVPR